MDESSCEEEEDDNEQQEYHDDDEGELIPKAKHQVRWHCISCTCIPITALTSVTQRAPHGR